MKIYLCFEKIEREKTISVSSEFQPVVQLTETRDAQEQPGNWSVFSFHSRQRHISIPGETGT